MHKIPQIHTTLSGWSLLISCASDSVSAQELDEDQNKLDHTVSQAFSHSNSCNIDIYTDWVLYVFKFCMCIELSL